MSMNRGAEWLPEGDVFTAAGPRLAQVLEPDWETKDNWFERELGAIMNHQWAAPLEPDVMPAGARTEGVGSAGETLHNLHELMLDPAPSIELLRSTRDYARSQLDGLSLPPDIARVLYYASALVARCRCHERIAELTDEELVTGADWVMHRDWVSAEIKGMFGEYRERIEANDDRS